MPPPDAPARSLARSAWSLILRFAVIYALLVAPWPGVENGYAAYFRGMGNVWMGSAVGMFGGGRTLSFAKPQEEVGNRDTLMLVGAKGASEVRVVPFVARIKGYLPTAMVVALVLATPIPWRRRWRALLWALLLVHLFIGFRMGVAAFHTFTRPTEFAWTTLGPASEEALRLAHKIFFKGYAMSFVVPAVVWIALCVRLEDLRGAEPSG